MQNWGSAVPASPPVNRNYLNSPRILLRGCHVLDKWKEMSRLLKPFQNSVASANVPYSHLQDLVEDFDDVVGEGLKEVAPNHSNAEAERLACFRCWCQERTWFLLWIRLGS